MEGIIPHGEYFERLGRWISSGGVKRQRLIPRRTN